MCCAISSFPHIVLDMTVVFILWTCPRNILQCLIIAIVLILRKLTRNRCYSKPLKVSLMYPTTLFAWPEHYFMSFRLAMVDKDIYVIKSKNIHASFDLLRTPWTPCQIHQHFLCTSASTTAQSSCYCLLALHLLWFLSTLTWEAPSYCVYELKLCAFPTTRCPSTYSAPRTKVPSHSLTLPKRILRTYKGLETIASSSLKQKSSTLPVKPNIQTCSSLLLLSSQSLLLPPPLLPPQEVRPFPPASATPVQFSAATALERPRTPPFPSFSASWTSTSATSLRLSVLLAPPSLSSAVEVTLGRFSFLSVCQRTGS